jgi:hypothetical protein
MMMIKIGGVGRACMLHVSVRLGGGLTQLSFEKTPHLMESLTKVAVVVIGVGGFGCFSLAFIDRTFEGIEKVVTISKPGSAEEQGGEFLPSSCIGGSQGNA